MVKHPKNKSPLKTPKTTNAPALARAAAVPPGSTRRSRWATPPQSAAARTRGRPGNKDESWIRMGRSWEKKGDGGKIKLELVRRK